MGEGCIVGKRGQVRRNGGGGGGAGGWAMTTTHSSYSI